jgi:hypothetical protein
MKSELLTLNWRDLLNGLIVSILTTVLPVLSDMVNLWEFNWQTIAKVSISAFIGYILKNLLTDEDGKFAGKI